jgi:hypothetical protein
MKPKNDDEKKKRLINISNGLIQITQEKNLLNFFSDLKDDLRLYERGEYDDDMFIYLLEQTRNKIKLRLGLPLDLEDIIFIGGVVQVYREKIVAEI